MEFVVKFYAVVAPPGITENPRSWMQTHAILPVIYNELLQTNYYPYTCTNKTKNNTTTDLHRLYQTTNC